MQQGDIMEMHEGKDPEQCSGLLPIINRLFKLGQHSPQQNAQTPLMCGSAMLVLTGENIWLLILHPSSSAFAPFN